MIPKVDPRTCSVHKGPYSDLSKKDLKNVCFFLSSRVDKKLRPAPGKRGATPIKSPAPILDILTTCVDHLVDRRQPISYKYHLTGVPHRPGIGPGKTPIKVYLYLKQVLKNLRGERINLKGMTGVELGIESSSNRRPGGYRRSSRGGMSVEDRRVHRVTLKFIPSSQ